MIEWEFVSEMLYALNFPTQFISWFMECLTTTQFIITMNDGMYENIKGKRGIRQSDPISPLIFIICIEYFTRLMRVTASMKGFKYPD